MSEDRDRDGADGAAEVRVAFWNTWLLAPRLWRTGPRMPGLDGWFAPDVELRAPLVGEALAGRFDIAALSECFEQSEQDAVSAAWPEARVVAGPGRRGPRLTGSGLATLVGPDVRLVRTSQLAYRSGGDLRDSDTFATKGAQMVAVRVADHLPIVEVVSTHLFAGGDLFPVPGADDTARHHRARMGQVEELVRFIHHEHDPDAVLLVVGDFNVMAEDPALAQPDERYRDLAVRLATAGLTDVWAEHGIGAGHTCTFASPDELPPDPDEPDQVADDAGSGPRAAASHSERIDYLWLSVPDGVRVGVDRPRRWAFPGRVGRGGPAGSLSDHLALSVTLRLHA